MNTLDWEKGHSYTANVFILNRIIEKLKELNLETNIDFIDYEKSFDGVKREKL